MKVRLGAKKYEGWKPPGWAINPVKLSMPYYISRKGTYVHRVRSAQDHWRKGQYSHTAIHFWCGNAGFLGKKGILIDDIGGRVLCATCEGRAVGAGVYGSRLINGREVMYSPRGIEMTEEK